MRARCQTAGIDRHGEGLELAGTRRGEVVVLQRRVRGFLGQRNPGRGGFDIPEEVSVRAINVDLVLHFVGAVDQARLLVIRQQRDLVER